MFWDFAMEEVSLADLDLSYLYTELIDTSTCPHVIIANDLQLQNFVGYVKKMFLFKNSVGYSFRILGYIGKFCTIKISFKITIDLRNTHEILVGKQNYIELLIYYYTKFY